MVQGLLTLELARMFARFQGEKNRKKNNFAARGPVLPGLILNLQEDVMINSEILQKEIYVIPINGYTLFYAPLTRNFYICEGRADKRDVDKQWLAKATDINNIPAFVRKGFDLDKKKIKLRINVTNRCNLRCSYCSIGNMAESKDMSIEMGLRVIDNFLEYAEISGAKEIEMTFSGGEPTLNMFLISKLIKHARINAKQGLVVSPRILTNGLFSQKEIGLILNDVDGIQISWDGFSGNKKRYGENAAVSKRVRRNIGFLCESGISPSILSVVSEDNHLFLKELVDDLYTTFGIENISLVFKDNLGRAIGKKENLDFKKFGKDYINIWWQYRLKDIDINLAGTDIHSIALYPCSLPHPNYSVSHDGKISACTVTFNSKNDKANHFLIGELGEMGLELNARSIESMRQFNVFNIVDCQDCFAKWHCRGGCVYAKQGDWFAAMDSDLCESIRWIVKNKLFLIISSDDKKEITVTL